MSRKCLAIVISQSFHIKNLIYSNLFRELCNEYDVFLISNKPFNELNEYLKENNLECGIVYIPYITSKFDKYFGFLRKNVFAGRKRTQTYNLITESNRANFPFLYRVTYILNIIFGSHHFFYDSFLFLESTFTNVSRFRHVLRDYEIKGVLTINYGTDPFEIRILKAARIESIPSFSIVPSWDNLTSKGVIGVKPDYLFVWNDIMKEEAKVLYNFEDHKVEVTGSLQFDHYFKENFPINCDIEKIKFKRDTESQIVFTYATINDKYFPYNYQTIMILKNLIETCFSDRNIKLVIRLHPQILDKSSTFQQEIEIYRKLSMENANINLSVPAIANFGSFHPPSECDLYHLKSLLIETDILFMPISTIALDAIVLGCNVVGIGFDGYEKKDYKESIIRGYDFTHYRNLVNYNSFEIAKSPEHMSCIIESILSDKSYKLNEKNMVIDKFLVFKDGESSTRIFKSIKEKI